MYLGAEKHIERYNKLKGNRGNFENIWQQVADVMIPFKNQIQKSSSPGESKLNDIYDSTAMISLEYLAGALHGMMTSPTSIFFYLSSGDPKFDSRDSVRMWLQDTVRAMHDALNGSNFQSEVHEYYIDLCGQGNGSLFMEEDDKEIVRFCSWPLGEVVVDENSKGVIDTYYHMYRLNARGMADEFGIPNLPERVRSCLENGRSDEFEILDCVHPKMKGEMNDKVNPKFPFISRSIFVPDKSDIHVGGFREFPLIFGRWSKVSGEIYGRGPGEKALPEAKVLNEMTKVTLRAAQKHVDPPLQAPDDGFIMPLITKPAGINYYRPGSQDRIEPIFANGQVDFGFQAIDMKRAQIREAFYVNQLALREGPQMTATEVNQRVEQALRFLAPMLGRQQSEFLSPLVSRLYAIMSRRGMLPAVPPELDGKPLKIVYSSVMAMAQRLSEMQNIQRTFSAITPLASIDPKVMHNFNVDRGARYIARMHNFPQEMLNTEKERDTIRKQLADAQAQAQETQNNMAQAQTLNDVMSATAKTQANAG
jgi:hypothetical protein